uniref:Uncharacterized protein n=1 Tax=Rhizophora mucronata TaxID=61149 RepID=A0A2P2N8I1_RHIMU
MLINRIHLAPQQYYPKEKVLPLIIETHVGITYYNLH